MILSIEREADLALRAIDDLDERAIFARRMDEIRSKLKKPEEPKEPKEPKVSKAKPAREPKEGPRIDLTDVPVADIPLPPAHDPLPPNPDYCALEFDTVFDLLEFLRPHLTPWDWQRETMEELSGYFEGIDRAPAKPLQSNPLYYNVVAANGSGKDSYIIAPTAVWFACSKIRARVIITSSSHDQLKHQTFNYISSLCREMNKALGEIIFDITEFNINCLKTGSQIRCFVTNEAGLAEGYHPFPDVPDAEMMVIVNEAKSIPDPMWTGFSRFTGYNYWIEISSPGPRSGHFFRTSSSENSLFTPDKPQLGRRFVRKVTAYECPNISRAHIEQVKEDYGEASPFFQSSVLANFTDIDESNLIKDELIARCLVANPVPAGDDIGIGLDLAGGGDENGCFIRMGNRIIDKLFFRQKDTDITAHVLIEFLAPYYTPYHTYVFRADNGGLGQAIVDRLVKFGWNINRTNNQSPASNKTAFLNLGAEMWCYVKRLIDRQAIIIPNVDKLRLQLTTRFMRGMDSTQGKFALEPKSEARAAGRPSPDRADAYVLCMSSYSIVDNIEPVDKRRLVSPSEFLDLYARGFKIPDDSNLPTRRVFSFQTVDV